MPMSGVTLSRRPWRVEAECQIQIEQQPAEHVGLDAERAVQL